MSAREESAWPAGSLLRTLAPGLRNLESHLRDWLPGPHPQPLKPIQAAALEGIALDLQRKAQDLDIEQPFLVIMLMGGTGVGKSSLLNALAGSPIAQASARRPTTRDPVVYYHRGLAPARFDPSLRQCHLVAHDRAALEHKVLVDTPDVDSNDLANRRKLEEMLPIADIVLYVGSQEKYHDKLVWEIFNQQRQRRAFAFVINKWDRCDHPSAAGSRPDDDLLRDLKQQGFLNPMLFRTSAEYWIAKERDGSAEPPPAGEQFPELVRWLEQGLTRLEIEAVKARGVGQLLEHASQTFAACLPPDLTEATRHTRDAWDKILDEEAEQFAELFLATLDPNQHEIEYHFRVQGQLRFSNLMGAYLGALNKIQHAGTQLRKKVSFSIGSDGPKHAALDLSSFAHDCIRVAGHRSLDSRLKALKHRLLVAADREGVPPDLLPPPVDRASSQDWKPLFESALVDALNAVEAQWSRPTGLRGWTQVALIKIANTLPELTLIAGFIVLLYRYFLDTAFQPSLVSIALPFLLVLVVLILLHVLTRMLLPLRWPGIRGEFRRQLAQRIKSQLCEVYEPIPSEMNDQLIVERQRVEKLAAEAEELRQYLEQQQKSAHIEGYYGR